jgi:hypothetical protein
MTASALLLAKRFALRPGEKAADDKKGMTRERRCVTPHKTQNYQQPTGRYKCRVPVPRLEVPRHQRKVRDRVRQVSRLFNVEAVMYLSLENGGDQLAPPDALVIERACCR